MLEELVAGLPDGIVLTDSEGKVLFFNQAAGELLHWESFEPGRQGIAGIDITEDGERQVYIAEYDQTLYIRRTTICWQGDSAILFFMRDLTEQVQTLGKARQFQELVERAMDMIVIFDAVSRTFQYVNSSVVKVLGYSKEEMLGMRPRDVILQPDLYQNEDFLELLTENRLPSKQVEFLLLHKDGKQIPTEFTVQYMDGPSGQGLFIGVGRDITERKMAQQASMRYQVLFQTTRDIIFFLSLDGTIVEVNRAATATYGYSRDELIGMNIRKISHPDTWISLPQYTAQALTSGVLFETLHLRRDGGSFPVEVSSRSMMSDGKMLLFNVVRDISERRQRENELLKLSRAVEQSASSVIMTDLMGAIEYVNPKFCEITGYMPYEVMGKTPRLLKSGVQPPDMYEKLWAIISAGGEWQGEFCNRRKNGELYWESASISPIRDRDGNMLGYLAVKEDITARKESEAALQMAHAELEHIFSAAADGMCVLDREGRIVRVNEALLQMMRLEREEAIGRFFREVVPLASLWDNDNYGRDQILQDGRRQEADVVFTLRNQRQVFCIVTAVPLLSPSGEVVGVVHNFKDITERQQTEEKLMKDALLAGHIQKAVLPPEMSEELVTIRTIYRAYNLVSGDLYDYIWHPEEKRLFGCLFDVMGHGIATALRSAALKVLMRQVATRKMSLLEKVIWMNRQALPYFSDDSFATLVAFEFDFAKQELEYCGAGINYFLITTPTECLVERAPGPFIGMMPDLKYETYRRSFHKGESFFFLTDGLLDMMDLENPTRSLIGDHEEVLENIRQLAWSERCRDDATAFCVHIRK